MEPNELYLTIGVLYAKTLKLEAEKQQLIEALRALQESKLNELAAVKPMARKAGRSRQKNQK